MATNERDQWINAQLQPRGERMRHTEQVRSGPAGYVLLVQTETNRYYFKVCENTSIHELALVAALSSWFPGCVPDVLAADDERHWLLMSDAGPTVRTLIRADGDRGRSEDIVREFAILQKKAIPYTGQLLAIGVPDRRPDKLPALFEQIIADTPALLVGQTDGVSEADLARLRAITPAVQAMGEQLAANPIPLTLQHDDFHTGNIGLKEGRYCFFDWGESFIAHPFYSLLIALRDARYILEYDDETLHRIRDTYLDGWTEYAPMEYLYELLDITHRLAALGRALSWWQVMPHADEHYRAENADAVPYWLLTFLNNTPLE
jgi:aminoglycoside/choline kinase family phosphotransferase